MAMPSASAVAAKWQQNTGSATQAYTDGVNAVTVSPGAAAARQANLWATNVALAKAKFAANSAKVSLDEWKQAAAGKGAQRLASGVQAAAPKFEQAMNKLLPAIASAVSSLPPRGTLENNIDRMTKFVRTMANYSG